MQILSSLTEHKKVTRIDVKRNSFADLLWEGARQFVNGGVVTANRYLLPKAIRVVGSRATRYSIPTILCHVDFRDAVVADMGSDLGTRDATSSRWGAKYAILLDIDVNILKARGNGPLIDKVAADAHMLSLRDKSVDVVVF
jgi:hypothetical protein